MGYGRIRGSTPENGFFFVTARKIDFACSVSTDTFTCRTVGDFPDSTSSVQSSSSDFSHTEFQHSILKDVVTLLCFMLF
jgi:hypothetical protein